MHAAFMWCSCHVQDATCHLAPLVKPSVKPDHLPEFFWMHLEKDFEHLSQVTGKSMEETTIIVHLVIKDILTKDPPTSWFAVLDEKKDRDQWERIFNTHYIQPVLKGLDPKINEAMDLIAEDDEQGTLNHAIIQ